MVWSPCQRRLTSCHVISATKDAFHKNHLRFLMVGVRLVMQFVPSITNTMLLFGGVMQHMIIVVAASQKETFPDADFPHRHPEIPGHRGLFLIAEMMVGELGGGDCCCWWAYAFLKFPQDPVGGTLLLQIRLD